jgi:hypothetical protein
MLYCGAWWDTGEGAIHNVLLREELHHQLTAQLKKYTYTDWTLRSKNDTE